MPFQPVPVLASLLVLGAGATGCGVGDASDNPIAGNGTRCQANPDDSEVPLAGLEADGSTVSARPEMTRTDDDRSDAVGLAEFGATCR